MEEWKDILGYEGLYKISAKGVVYSVRRKKYRKTRTDKYGYIVVALNKDGTQHPYFVHRLVASAFLPNPDNLPEVNHMDGNKENNCVSNLEWCNHSANMQHAYASGLMPYKPKPKKEKNTLCCSGKLTLCIASEIRSEYAHGKRGYGYKALAKKYGVSTTTIKDIINKKIWRGSN